MISHGDRERISAIARKYHAKRVLLFGSCLHKGPVEARDIDLAVEGVAPGDFFRLYADLIFALSKPVDLVDLDDSSRFSRMIAGEGIPVYG